LIQTFVRKDIGKTIDDTRQITDVFYHHSTIDELVNIMSERIAADSVNPLPYLFLSKINRKRGDTDKAKEILKHYMMTYEPKAVVVRVYAHLTEDPVLLRAALWEDNYKCSECGVKYVEFVEICSNCGNIDTLNYL
jgi:lipopolysaccharide biosynthesis regulator YciM